MTSAADSIHASAATPSSSLPARAFGVVFSPRATYAEIVARPRSLAALLTVAVVTAAVNFAFLSTAVGRRAVLDWQQEWMESLGMNVNDAMLDQFESLAPRLAYYSAAGTVVAALLATVVIAGIAFFIFSALLGGSGTYSQVLAVVAHAGFLSVLQLLFITPLNYVRESMSSATSLLVFLPMVDDHSVFGMLLGSIDFFRIWLLVSLAIGLGVLYKKRTAPIACSLLAVYGGIILVVASIRAAVR